MRVLAITQAEQGETQLRQGRAVRHQAVLKGLGAVWRLAVTVGACHQPELAAGKKLDWGYSPQRQAGGRVAGGLQCVQRLGGQALRLTRLAGPDHQGLVLTSGLLAAPQRTQPVVAGDQPEQAGRCRPGGVAHQGASTSRVVL